MTTSKKHLKGGFKNGTIEKNPRNHNILYWTLRKNIGKEVLKRGRKRKNQ